MRRRRYFRRYRGRMHYRGRRRYGRRRYGRRMFIAGQRY